MSAVSQRPRIIEEASSLPPVLEVVGVEKTYRTLRDSGVAALTRTSLAFAPGEFVSILGPSGCGKTTLLNLMAGLIRPSAGEIRFRGRTADGPSPEVSVVFQRPVLLPWRKIIDNVLLPVEVLGLRPRARYVEKARELLAMVGLTGFEDAYPRELSGGMQQRAAIARALVYQSSVLLMDEPFGALDAMTREELNLELLRIWKAAGLTVVFVTHNIAEAVLLSDRIVVMTARPGQVRKILAVGLERPRTLSLFGDPRFGRIADEIRSLLRGQGGATEGHRA